MAAVIAPAGTELRHRFPVMGTTAEVVAVGGSAALIEAARRRLLGLEARWSRFRQASDVSAMNRCHGCTVPVAPETLLLVERALQAARATDGRYDPTIGHALVSHGYDRDFAALSASAAAVAPTPEIDGSWPAIQVDHVDGTVHLPEGTMFDPGGIGKGLAADLVATELGADAAGLLVNLGGDVRMVGTGPDSEGWIVTVEDPFDPTRELARLAIPEGAVATSSTLRRRWATAAGQAHHIIDPRTGRPAATGVVATTVVAAESWWAEIWATALLLAGPDALEEIDPSIEALLVLDDGTVRATPSLEATLR